MPLGFFSSSSNKDGGPKPQPLNSEKEKKYKDVASSSAAVDIKDAKGSTIKLGKKSYVVERKLAEGGFAIVYLVQDKHNRCYALKRQLIRDDQRQVEACKTEAQIVKNLNGHANIVGYVDHSLTVSKAGIYDYMLLTVYYKANLLQMMNSRLLSNKWFSPEEILNIFCDVCEAVARLHHSKTPVIHRDLKVENILIDERTGGERPIYVLCDFGSATTKVLSRDTMSQVQLEEEIKKYTTPSYRAPEMIDLFSVIPIDTKSDIWALGVMLFKICYFSLPFGESVLAVQNGSFTYPDVPVIPDEIKAIINLLLTSSAKHRPNIYQVSYLAFSAAKRKCPVYNIELTEAVEIYRMREKLGANYARRFEKALNDFEEQQNREKSNQRQQIAQKVLEQRQPTSAAPTTTTALSVQSDAHNNSSKPKEKSGSPPSGSDSNSQHTVVMEPSVSREGVIVNTAAEDRQTTYTTSVNPRLRPKASSTVSGQFLPPVGTSPRVAAKAGSSDHQGAAAAYTNATMSASDHSAVPRAMEMSTSSAPSQSQGRGDSAGTYNTPHQQQLGGSSTAAGQDRMKTSQISTESAKSAPLQQQQQKEHEQHHHHAYQHHQQQQDQPDAAASNNYQRTSSSLVGETHPFTQAELTAEPRARNAATLPATALRTSAFQPYSMCARNKSDVEKREGVKKPTVANEHQQQQQGAQLNPKSSSLDMSLNVVRPPSESLNPFIAEATAASFMDDNDFGERFDQIRRVNRRNTVVSSMPERRAAVQLIEEQQHQQDHRHAGNGSLMAFQANTTPVRSAGDARPFGAALHHYLNAVAQSGQLPSADPLTEHAIQEDPFGCAPILPAQVLLMGASGVPAKSLSNA